MVSKEGWTVHPLGHPDLSTHFCWAHRSAWPDIQVTEVVLLSSSWA